MDLGRLRHAPLEAAVGLEPVVFVLLVDRIGHEPDDVVVARDEGREDDVVLRRVDDGGIGRQVAGPRAAATSTASARPPPATVSDPWSRPPPSMLRGLRGSAGALVPTDRRRHDDVSRRSVGRPPRPCRAQPRDAPARSGRTAKGEATALPPHDYWERSLRAGGFARVAGLDEAGRGPLAGPVSAAAVILDPEDVPEGIDDSKAMSAAAREAVCAAVLARALAVGVGFATAAEIDALNIRQATFAAMRRAVRALALDADHVLIDGRDVPPGLPCPGPGADQGRQPVGVDRGGLHRGEGHPRPADGPARRRPPGLWLRDPQGLPHGGPPGRPAPARAVAVPPAELRHGGAPAGRRDLKAPPTRRPGPTVMKQDGIRGTSATSP